MGLFSNHYAKPGPGIEKNAPGKHGLALFFEIFFREFFELLKLNLLFLLFCIPIVTIPAAVTAMSRLTMTMVRDENHFLWADFVKAFKADFKESLFTGLIVFGSLAAACYGIFFYMNMAKTNNFFYLPMAMICCLSFIMILMSFYVFPMIAFVNLPLKQLLKNAFLLAAICILPNTAAFAVVAVVVLLFVGLLPFSLPAIFVMFFALLNLITTFCAYGGIKQYVIHVEN